MSADLMPAQETSRRTHHQTPMATCTANAVGIDEIGERRRSRRCEGYAASACNLTPSARATLSTVAKLGLAHRIDIEWMQEAYRRTRKDGAVGVDGVNARVYERAMEENQSSLLDRFKSGQYRAAPAVRRVHIDKDGGRATRPIGIPTLEDKILQRAELMVLEPVYEQDFLECWTRGSRTT